MVGLGCDVPHGLGDLTVKRQPQYEYAGKRLPWMIDPANPIIFACTGGIRSHHHLKDINARLRKATVRSGFRYTMLGRADPYASRSRNDLV